MVKINNREVPEFPGTKFIVAWTPYPEHLKRIRNRLESEAGFFFECFDRRKLEEPDKQPVGFFSFVRMLMPVIESIALTEGIEPEEMLRKLGFKSPYLTWNLYRDVFLHGDEFMPAALGERGVAPGIAISEGRGPYSHTMNHSYRLVDVRKLYYDILNYLDNRIDDNNLPDKVQVIVRIEYDKTAKNKKVKKIIEEILEEDHMLKHNYS